MEAALHAGSLLAAGLLQPLSENSRPGHPLSTVSLYPGIGFVNSNTATGLRVCLYDDGRRSRDTGKERDSESGLDYFGARFYGSALGRFTSPDWSDAPVPVPFATLSNPQTLNLYAYVGNNPLSTNDPLGHNWFTDFLNGIANATYRPIITAVEHPILAGRAIGNSVAHPIATYHALKNSTVTTTQQIMAGNGTAIGTAVGTVGMAFIPGVGEVGDAAEGAADLAKVGEVADAAEATDAAAAAASAPVNTSGYGISGVVRLPLGTLLPRQTSILDQARRR